VPASSLTIVRALVDAGVPAGVIAVVFGVPAHICEYLLKSPVIRKISFTGSVTVGKQLLKLAADGMKRSTMELGGHAPVLVFEDADMNSAVEQSVLRKYRNAGQVCVGPTRFYVQSNAFENFCARFAAGAKAIKVGNGLDESNKMGPLAHARRIEFIQGLIDDAVSKGAKLLAGGKRIAGPGYFFEPTVLAEVPDAARIMHEEPFGPIASINRFRDFADGIAKANSLPYGLAAFAFTRSSTTMLAVADALEAGMVAINSFNIALADTPFGGIKESGHGAENGIEGVENCMTTKTISLA
jgi:succinate-semialdehyde dehydrogenase/glutarate-semialdehyde dehydrogenase